MKKSEEIVSSTPLTRAPYPPLTRSPFPNGEGKEEAASPPKKEANPASLRSVAPSKGRGLRGYSLLPMEGGAPKRRRLDGDGGVKKSEGDRLKYAINESTLSTVARSPFPNGGRLRNENTAFLASSERIHACVEKQYGRTKPSPRGEGGERSEPDRVLAV